MSKTKPEQQPADANKMLMYRQEEANYVELSGKRGQACANCRWFKPYGNYDDERPIPVCHIVDSYPLDILATGWCEQWQGKPPGNPYEPVPAPVYIVPDPDDDDLMEDERAHDHAHGQPDGEGFITPGDGFLRKAARAISGEKLHPGTTVLKAADGRRLLFMVTTNAYKDRENETMLSEALKRYVDSAWTDDGQFIGEQPLLVWHDKNIPPVGELIYTDLWGPFVVEVFKELPDVWPELYFDYLETTDVPHGASFGFQYLLSDKEQGDYRAFRKFESSSLPLDAAANLLTFSGVIKAMATRDDYLKGIFQQAGMDVDPADLRSNFDGVVAKLTAAGVEHKDKDGAEPAAPTVDLSKVAQLVIKMAEDLGDVVGRLDTVETAQAEKANNDALTAVNGRLDSIDAALKDVGDALKLRPRATQAEATVVPDEDGAKAKQQMSEPDEFWGGLVNVKPGSEV